MKDCNGYELDTDTIHIDTSDCKLSELVNNSYVKALYGYVVLMEQLCMRTV